MHGFLGVCEGFFVSVELGEKSAHLHVSFTLVLVFLESFIGKFLDVVFETRVEIQKACFYVERAFFESPDFLVAHGHVVKYC